MYIPSRGCLAENEIIQSARAVETRFRRGVRCSSRSSGAWRYCRKILLHCDVVADTDRRLFDHNYYYHRKIRRAAWLHGFAFFFFFVLFSTRKICYILENAVCSGLFIRSSFIYFFFLHRPRSGRGNTKFSRARNSPRRPKTSRGRRDAWALPGRLLSQFFFSYVQFYTTYNAPPTYNFFFYLV